VKTGSRTFALVCVAALLLGGVSCSNDDDEMMGGQQVSSSQAEIIMAQVISSSLDFSLSIVGLVQATAPAAPPAAKAVQGDVCPPIPGIETQYLCTDPNTGVVCPVDAMTSEWQFTSCDVDGTDVDGTVTIEGSGPFTLTFDLTLDGSQSAMGEMVVTFGTTCDTIDYNQLILKESGVTSNLLGELQSCAGVPGGFITATINAPGLQTFIGQISISTGGLIVTVLDGQSQNPLYLCGCAIDPQNLDNTACLCDPYGQVPG